jgi:hypothetical protein
MRWACLLVLSATLPSTGCTALLAESGRNPAALTRQVVTEEFDAPVATDNPDGTSSLTFRTHRKIAEPITTMYAIMGSVGTAGLAELIMFPVELRRVTRTALLGSGVRVDYYPTGEVKGVSVNGDPVYSGPAPSAPAELRAAPSTSGL